jgi:hypothetical protein
MRFLHDAVPALILFLQPQIGMKNDPLTSFEICRHFVNIKLSEFCVSAQTTKKTSGKKAPGSQKTDKGKRGAANDDEKGASGG